MKNGAKSKPMLKASAKTPFTGKIGGPSNATNNPSSAKGAGGMKFNKGGKVRC